MRHRHFPANGTVQYGAPVEARVSLRYRARGTPSHTGVGVQVGVQREPFS